MTHKFKVGQKVMINCPEHPFSNGRTGIVSEIKRNSSDYPYTIQFDDNGAEGDWSEGSLISLAKSLDDPSTLEAGDILVDEDGDEKTILGICGRVIFVSEFNTPDEIDDYITAQELKNCGWNVKGAEEEVEELTVEEVSERLGHTVKIVKSK